MRNVIVTKKSKSNYEQSSPLGGINQQTMKRSIIYFGLLFALVLPSTVAQKKVFKETIKKEIAFENTTEASTMILKNIFGSIAVEGYDGDMIILEVDKKIMADNQLDLELGKEELQLKAEVDGNRVVIHPDAPYINFVNEEMGFNWCKDYEEPKYKHKMDFRVKVPRNLQLVVGTINEGEVLVQNTRGTYLKVSNINGGIELNDVKGETHLNCINGDVTITYVDNPPKDSRYYSLNGDINVSYQNGLSANVSFKTMNGELYTDFDVERQFVKTSKTNDVEKAKFKYESTPTMQIGGGDVALDFETLNGNVFIKKI